MNNKWNLSDLYQDDAAWTAAKDTIASQVDDILQYKNTLCDSAKNLYICLSLKSNLSKEFYRLMCYSSMHADEDLRVSKYTEMKQIIQDIAVKFGTNSAFIEPAILKLSLDEINVFIQEEKGLEEYKVYLYDILRSKSHMLNESEEQIMAQTSVLANTPYSAYSILSNADIPYPEIIIENEKVRLDHSAYGKYRATKNRDVRKQVFDEFWNTMAIYKRTFATVLYGNMQKDVFYTRVRKYESCLERALFSDNIPCDVYSTLIKNCNDNLPVFHQYLSLKKEMLGVDQLHYYDVYAPVVEELQLEYSYEDAKKMVIDACVPLGEAYQKVIQESYDKGWIDVYPSQGKRSGAYCNGSAYDVHPYVLLNYNAKYNDVSTLAHELGHAMHSYYSNKVQPFALCDYSIFVAEVASIVNEQLLIHHQLSLIEDKKTRISLLMHLLDSIKGTVFRQTQFSEFELTIHTLVEEGKPLSDEVLTNEYKKLVRKYYGHDTKHCLVDEAYCVEWSFIPHFYYNFYVYQYATSHTAATLITQWLIEGKEGIQENYIKFLSSGSSKYPIDLLKDLGVDMLSSVPFDKTMDVMKKVMKEINELI